MQKAGQVLDMSPLGMIFTVVKSAEDTNGASLDLHWRLLPKCNMVDPLYHIHPEAIETYHVLKGEMEFYVKDKWIEAKAGDKLTVEKGVKHAFRVPGDEEVEVYNTHEPAFSMGEYFEDVVKVLDHASRGKTKEVSMKDIKTLLHFGVLMNNYRKEIIAVDPPDVLVRILGKLGHLFGFDYNQRYKST